MAVALAGLRPLTQPARLGPQHMCVLASDNMGGQLRVVVDANTGRILRAAPAHDPRFAYHPVRPRGFVPIPPPQHGVMAPPPTYSAAPPPDLRTPRRRRQPPPRTARAAPAPQTPPAARRHTTRVWRARPMPPARCRRVRPDAATAPAAHDGGERSERSRCASFAGAGACRSKRRLKPKHRPQRSLPLPRRAPRRQSPRRRKRRWFRSRRSTEQLARIELRAK